jgi:hypothetical protein
MTIQRSILLGSILLTGILMGTACSSSSTAPDEAASAQSGIPSIAPFASAAAGPSASPASTSSSSKPAQASPSPIAPAASAEEVKKELMELLELAKQGKVPGVEFAAHTDLIEDVEKAWGEPDKKESAGQGIYSTYSKKNAVIGFNKGSVILDVRSSASKLQELTLPQIEAALGKPQDTKANGDDTIYIYKANDQFQLKFIIPASSGKVDHISVFSPGDAVNNMAG